MSFSKTYICNPSNYFMNAKTRFGLDKIILGEIVQRNENHDHLFMDKDGNVKPITGNQFVRVITCVKNGEERTELMPGCMTTDNKTKKKFFAFKSYPVNMFLKTYDSYEWQDVVEF